MVADPDRTIFYLSGLQLSGQQQRATRYDELLSVDYRGARFRLSHHSLDPVDIEQELQAWLRGPRYNEYMSRTALAVARQTLLSSLLGATGLSSEQIYARTAIKTFVIADNNHRFKRFFGAENRIEAMRRAFQGGYLVPYVRIDLDYDDLTDKEFETIQTLYRGRTNSGAEKDQPADLRRTATEARSSSQRVHASRAYRKLGVHNQHAAALLLQLASNPPR